MEKIKVYAQFSQEAYVDPKDVIKKLIEEEVGHGGWVAKIHDKYYRVWEEHHDDFQKEITQEQYEYVSALNLVLERLKGD